MYKRTLRSFAAVGIILAAMICTTAIASIREGGSPSHGAIAAQTAAPAAPEETAAIITPTPAPTASAPGRYQGIEPNVTEPPGRAGFVYYPDVGLDKVMQDFIFVEAGEAAVDYELVIAVIMHESRCDPGVVSETNDYGLMQINKINHAWLAEQYGLTDMLDPRQNIIAGITILAQQSAHADGTEAGYHKMLMAYNMGATGAARAWAQGIYTTAYSRAVMQIRADLLAGQYGKEEV